MTFWFVIAAMAAAAAAILLYPFVKKTRAAPARLDFDLAVYKDQLDEIARDAERGTLRPQEAAAARLEIERRILNADSGRAAPAASRAGRAARAGVVAAAVLGPLLAVALYLDQGAPGMPDYPFAERKAAQGRAPQIDMAKIAGMVEKLADRMQKEPGNLKGWTMLGRSYVMLQRYDDGAAAFAHAATLDPKDATLPSSEGEALVFASGGIVTPKARDAFEAALAIDPKEPQARFYLGLASMQAGEPRAALAAWEALAADGPKDAPWLPPLQKQIAKLKEALGNAAKDAPAKPKRPAGSE